MWMNKKYFKCINKIADHQPWCSGKQNPPAKAGDAGDMGLIPGSGRSLEEEMAIHTSILAWKIPWTEEPGRLESMGLQLLSHVRPLWLHGLYSPWNSPGHDIGMGSLSLLQGIFPTQGSNPGLLHCRQILYQLSHQGSPRILEWVAYLFSRGSSQPRNWTGVSYIAGRFFTSWATREAHRIWVKD